MVTSARELSASSRQDCRAKLQGHAVHVPTFLTTTPNQLLADASKRSTATKPDSPTSSTSGRLTAKDLPVQPQATQAVATYQSYMERRAKERRRLLQLHLLRARRQSRLNRARLAAPVMHTTIARAPMTTQLTTAVPVSPIPSLSPTATSPPTPCSRKPAIQNETAENHFTHLFSQRDIKDGFDPARARALQGKINDDPASRRLPDGRVVYGCSECEVSFVWRRHLERHFEEHRSSAKSMLCRLCGKCFTRPDHLNRHCSTAHEACAEMTCQLCGETFARASHLDRHWVAAHKDNDFLPEGCPSNIATSPGSVSSASSSISQPSSPTIIPVMQYPVSGMPVSYVLGGQQTFVPRPQQFPLPAETFSTSPVFAVQTRTSTQQVSPPSDQSSCPSPPQLLRRTSSESDPFSCEHCGRHFARRSHLRAHVATCSDVDQTSVGDASDSGSHFSQNVPALIPGQDMEANPENGDQVDEHQEETGEDVDDACSYQVECSDTEWIDSPEAMDTEGDLVIDEDAYIDVES